MSPDVGPSILIWLLVWLLLGYAANVGLCALAYKINNGAAPLDMEPGEYWYRAAVAAAGVTVLAVMVAVVAGLVQKEAAVLVAVGVAVVPGGLYLNWVYALDDIIEGIKVFLLWLIVPAVLGVLLWWLGAFAALARRYLA